jgi:two-component system, chemotaxis family, protein-glutamate methylesterase/glutaminase
VAGRDAIVVGASAGGVEALMALVGGLPHDLPAALFVVLHLPADASTALPAILERAGPLPAELGTDRAPIKRGRIYVAPPNRHMVVERERVRLVAGPRENRVRPAADPLFRSAARHFGGRAIGVVLSGALDDGTNGLAAIAAAGGVTIAQHPDDAMFSSMPLSAAARVDLDYRLPAHEIGPVLAELARERPNERGGVALSEELRRDPLPHAEPAGSEDQKRTGVASGFTCPDCHGSLWELADGDAVRYECRIGHAYSVESMLAAQAESLENALWAALNALEERAATLERVAQVSSGRSGTLGGRLTEQARETTEQARTLREALLRSIATQGVGTNGGRLEA